MGYKLELNPEAFARTQQGGCVMTATDTDTNIIEPLILKEGRASGRTAINRDGLLYDVLPYEPAMSLKDGVMVLSNEPLGETLIFNSGWKGGDTPTNWSVGFAGGSRVSSLINESLDAYALTFSVSNDRNTIYRLINYVSGTTYNASVEVGSVTGGLTIRDCIYHNATGTRTYYKNGILANDTDIVESGNIYSAVLEATATASQQIRLGAGAVGNATGTIVMYYPQLEEGTVRTSFIISPIGATAVRLGATGVVTPNISKYINGSDFTFEISFYYESQSSLIRRFTLSDGTSSNRVRITSNSNAGSLSVNFDINGTSSLVVFGSTLSAGLNTVKLIARSGYYEAILNEVSLGINNQAIAFNENDIKYIEASDVNNTVPFTFDIKTLKLES